MLTTSNTNKNYISDLTKHLINNYLFLHTGKHSDYIKLKLLDISNCTLPPFWKSKENLYMDIIKVKNNGEHTCNIVKIASKDDSFKTRIKNNLSKIKYIFEQGPGISSSNNYINQLKWPKVFFIKNKRFVISKLKSVKEMVNNFVKIEKLITLSKKFHLPKDVAFIRTTGDEGYMITSWEWKVIEDEIKEGKKINIQKFVKNVDLLLELMDQKGIYWYSIAPRNIIYKNNKLILIDFEKTFTKNEITKEKKDYYEKFIPIWFSDVIEYRIKGAKEQLDEIDLKVNSDDFEEAWFGNKTISKVKREELLYLTSEIEKKHPKNWTIVYGHSIWQYLTDYLETKEEVIIYKFIKELDKKDYFYFMRFVGKCCLLDYNTGYFQDWCQKEVLNLMKNLIDVIKQWNKWILNSIKKFFNNIQNEKFDLYQEYSLFLCFMNGQKYIKKNILKNKEVEKLISLKVKSLKDYKKIIKVFFKNGKVYNKNIKNFYKKMIKKVLWVIGKNKNTFLLLWGSYVHNNMNFFSDLDWYFFTNWIASKSNITLIEKYKAALGCVGIFVNENIFSIMNQYVQYDYIIKLCQRKNISFPYKNYERTDESEDITLRLLDIYKFRRDVGTFLMFYEKMLDEFFKLNTLNEMKLPVNEVYWYVFEYVFGDKNSSNKFIKNINLLKDKYELWKTKIAYNEYKNAVNTKKLRKIENIKWFNVPIYRIIYFFYRNKYISTPEINEIPEIKNAANILTQELMLNNFNIRKYHYYLYYFHRKFQIDIKKIAINKHKNNKIIDKIIDNIILTKVI